MPDTGHTVLYPSPGVPVPVPTAEAHHVDFTYAHHSTWWACSCGARSRGASPLEAEAAGYAHRDDAARARLADADTPTLIAALARPGAHNPPLRAALDLLAAHGTWLAPGSDLRRYLTGGWETDTDALYAKIDYGAAVQDLGAGRLRAPTLGDANILRLAASIAHNMPVQLRAVAADLPARLRFAAATTVARLLDPDGDPASRFTDPPPCSSPLIAQHAERSQR